MKQIFGTQKAREGAHRNTRHRHGKNVDPKRTQIGGGGVHLKPKFKKA